MKFLFWNTGKQNVDAELIELISTNQSEFVVLAEYAGNTKGLLQQLSNKGVDFFSIPSIGCERIKIFSTLTPSEVKHYRETDRYTIKEIRISGKNPLLVGLVHLPSKLHADDLYQYNSAMFFRKDIEEAEKDAGHSNTILFGDFNMNPFDSGMIAANGINSLSCLNTAKKRPRTVDGKQYSFFYNPSWNLLGDFNGTPGTYFHSSPGYLSHYWNTLDQVVVRPAIAKYFHNTSLKILKSAGPISLVNKEGRPKISDHLPIVFNMNMPEEISHGKFVA